MKKKIVTIALIVGAAAFNLSVLCQAHCAGIHKERAAHMNADAGQGAAPGLCVTHKAADADAAGDDGYLHNAGSGYKCGSCAGGYAFKADFRLDGSSVEISPRESAVAAIMPAEAVFDGISPVPQERPPRPLV